MTAPHKPLDPARDRILHAAIREFSEHGLAGARTSAIAAAARVNKALLYYYFRDKEALYATALEEVAGKIAGDALAVLDLPSSAGERMLRFVLQHFDRISSQNGFQALMQQEMVRFRAGHSNALRIIAEKAFLPMWDRTLQVIGEGIDSGELCDVDPLQMMYSALGANVFYFLSAPMVHLVGAFDPKEPGAVATRRRTAIEYLGHAIFTDRKHGARLAKTVLATTPNAAVAVPEKKTA
ncbi:MAG: TetR/AcrR family transcriptional regulator [Acidobacteriota bacterium]